MTVPQTVAFVVVAVTSVVMFLMLGSVFGGRHRKRRLPIHAFFPLTGLWELSIGVFIATQTAVAEAIGPLMIGTVFVVGWLVWRRIRNRLTP